MKAAAGGIVTHSGRHPLPRGLLGCDAGSLSVPSSRMSQRDSLAQARQPPSPWEHLRWHLDALPWGTSFRDVHRDRPSGSKPGDDSTDRDFERRCSPRACHVSDDPVQTLFRPPKREITILLIGPGDVLVVLCPFPVGRDQAAAAGQHVGDVHDVALGQGLLSWRLYMPVAPLTTSFTWRRAASSAFMVPSRTAGIAMSQVMLKIPVSTRSACG